MRSFSECIFWLIDPYLPDFCSTCFSNQESWYHFITIIIIHYLYIIIWSGNLSKSFEHIRIMMIKKSGFHYLTFWIKMSIYHFQIQISLWIPFAAYVISLNFMQNHRHSKWLKNHERKRERMWLEIKSKGKTSAENRTESIINIKRMFFKDFQTETGKNLISKWTI